MTKRSLALVLFVSSLFTSLCQAAGEAIPGSISNASGAVTDPASAADGDIYTLWNSGGPPTQWIDLDLGFNQRIRQVRMLIAQTPGGDTTHNVYGRTTAGEWVYFGSISKYTSDYDHNVIGIIL